MDVLEGADAPSCFEAGFVSSLHCIEQQQQQQQQQQGACEAARRGEKRRAEEASALSTPGYPGSQARARAREGRGLQCFDPYAIDV